MYINRLPNDRALELAILGLGVAILRWELAICHSGLAIRLFPLIKNGP